ncbi:MAG: polyprenyl synthetase family protein [Candidatus Marsarchaeota archaeon]|nr:polyprenyl synthetase family protein [Candidatus Marsarchaeota archaeon]
MVNDCMETPKINIENVPDFRGLIALYKPVVYNVLKSYMPGSEAGKFGEMVNSYTDRIGQYRRPAYLILWNMLYGGKAEEGILPAAAQQCTEDYYLMHDDWMDGNSIRRGKEAAHILYGPEYAILAGDMVHAISWKIAKDANNMIGGERGERYFNKFYDIMSVTHIGQYLDVRLTSEVKDITKFTEEDYFKSIHAKSAYYSVYGPMQCGAIIAGASEEKLEGIREYGIPVGNAFQIKDDILDCVSTEEKLGKGIGTDVRDGVKTVILLNAVRNSSSSQLEKLKSIYAKDRKDKTDEDVRWVLDLFNEVGAVKEAEERAENLVRESSEKFEKFESGIPESKIKNIARESIGYVTKRKE